MSFYERVPANEEDIWSDPDEIIEVRRSNLQRARNAHLLIGCGFGVVATIAIQYLVLWVFNIV